MNKQRWTVLTCWAVALALVLIGVGLGISVPSAADTANAVTVTFNGKSTPYTTLNDAFTYVNTLTTTAENPAKVQLQDDIVVTEQVMGGVNVGKHVIWDLNGHLVTVNYAGETAFQNLGALRIIDSRPTITHELPNGETMVGGGFFAGEGSALGIWNAGFVLGSFTENFNRITLTIAGGNYMGNGAFVTYGNIIMEDGNIAWQYEGYKSGVCVLPIDERNQDITFTMNGGTLHSEIYLQNQNGEITDETTRTQFIKLGENMEKATTEDGKTVYQVKTTTDPEPTEPTPDPEPEPEPNPDDEQPNTEPEATGLTTQNIVGLFLIGAALAAVVLFSIAAIVEACHQSRQKADTPTKQPQDPTPTPHSGATPSQPTAPRRYDTRVEAR